MPRRNLYFTPGSQLSIGVSQEAEEAVSVALQATAEQEQGASHDPVEYIRRFIFVCALSEECSPIAESHHPHRDYLDLVPQGIREQTSQDQASHIWATTLGSYISGWSNRSADPWNSGEISTRATTKLSESLPQLRFGLDRECLPAGFTWSEGIIRPHLDFDPLRVAKDKIKRPMAVELIPSSTPPLSQLEIQQRINQWGERFKSNPNQYRWWMTLANQHMQAVPYDNIDALYKAFSAFSNKLNQWNLRFPEQCHFQNILSMPTALSHMATIIANCKPEDRLRQLSVISSLDLSSTGAVPATRGNNRACFVTPEMNCTFARYFDLHTRADSWDVEDTWHYVATRKDQAPLEFYIQAFKLIEQKRYDEATAKRFRRFLADSTTGSNVAVLKKEIENGTLINVFHDYLNTFEYDPLSPVSCLFIMNNLPPVLDPIGPMTIELTDRILFKKKTMPFIAAIPVNFVGALISPDHNDLDAYFNENASYEAKLSYGGRREGRGEQKAWSVRFYPRGERNDARLKAHTYASKIISKNYRWEGLKRVDLNMSERTIRLLLENISTFSLNNANTEAVVQAWLIVDQKLREDRIIFLTEVFRRFTHNHGLTAKNLIDFANEIHPCIDNADQTFACIKKYFSDHLPKNFFGEEIAMLYAIDQRYNWTMPNVQNHLARTFVDRLLRKSVLDVIKICENANDDDYNKLISDIEKVRVVLDLSDDEFLDFTSKLCNIKRKTPDRISIMLAEVLKARSLGPFYYMISRGVAQSRPIQQFYIQQKTLHENCALIATAQLWPLLSTLVEKEQQSHLPIIYSLLVQFKTADFGAKILIVKFFEKVINENMDIGINLLYQLSNVRAVVSFETLESLLTYYMNSAAVLSEILKLLDHHPHEKHILRIIGLLASNPEKRPDAQQIQTFIEYLDNNPGSIDALEQRYNAPPYVSLSQIHEPVVTNIHLEFNSGTAAFKIAQFSGDGRPKLETLTRFTAHVEQVNAKNTNVILEHLKSSVDPESMLAHVLAILKSSTGLTLNETQILVLLACLKENNLRQLAQVETGEGKSRIMMVMAACKVLQGKTVDFVTSNMQLARRDRLVYADFFKALNIPTRVIYAGDSSEVYQKKGINFTEPGNFALYCNKLYTQNKLSQTLDVEDQRVLLLDEADRLMLDTPERFNFAVDLKQDSDAWIYPLMVKFMISDEFKKPFFRGDHIEDVEACNAAFRQWVRDDIDRAHYSERLDEIEDEQLETWYVSAIQALHLKAGTHFNLENDTPVLTREGIRVSSQAILRQNARISRASSYSHGVHQFIHAWQNARRERARKRGELVTHLAYHIEPERNTVCSSDPKQLLSLYKHGQIFGTSGTLGDAQEREEITLKYNLKLLDVPRETTNIRQDRPIVLLEDKNAKFKHILSRIGSAGSQPILIVCKNDTESAQLHEFLRDKLSQSRKQALSHVTALSTPEEEAQAIKRAGLRNAITISTEMLGRGADIEIDAEVNALGGLQTWVTYLTSKRDLTQVIGRSGRHGQEGYSASILSKEDLKTDLGVSTLHRSAHSPYSFYKNANEFIAYHQAKMTKIKSTQRLISEREMEYRQYFIELYYGWKHQQKTGDSTVLDKLWGQFLHGLDTDWGKIHQNLLSQMPQLEKPNQALIDEAFMQYQAAAVRRWEKLQTKIPAMLKDFPSCRTEDIQVAQGAPVKPLENIRMALKPELEYCPEFAGRTVIYSKIFAETRAMSIFGGNRRFMDNTRAWWEGRGILFANTRGWLTGDREWFANVKASRCKVASH